MPDPSHARAHLRDDKDSPNHDMSYVVARRVRAERTRLGMLPIDLAKKAGVNVSTIYSLEAATNPTLSTLMRVAEALGVPIASLLAEEEARPEEKAAGDDPPRQKLAVRVAQLEHQLGEIKEMLSSRKGRQRK